MGTIEQALVTCGGDGTRLRIRGMDFPASKSFIEFEGHRVLYWCLLGLHRAGISRIVVAAEGSDKLDMAGIVLSGFPYSFSKVDMFKDDGLGTNVLPYLAKHLLDDHFIFEFGHSMSEPGHYDLMRSELADEEDVVFSRFEPNRFVSRAYVKLADGRACPIDALSGDGDEFSVCYPALLSQRYIERWPEVGFKLNGIVRYYCERGSLKTVASRLPIEVDVIEEWEQAVPVYRSHVHRLIASVK